MSGFLDFEYRDGGGGEGEGSVDAAAWDILKSKMCEGLEIEFAMLILKVDVLLAFPEQLLNFLQ